MAFILLFGISLVLQTFLLCRPFAKIWDGLLPGTCASGKAIFLASGIINIVIDLIMIILPMPLVWQLQMSQQRKFALSAVFALGILYVFPSTPSNAIILTISDRVCTVTIVRVVLANQFYDGDITHGIAKVAIVTDLETCMGIIVACLPMFPPTFKRILHGRDKSDPQNYISSSVARLRTKTPKTLASRAIDDLYPLTDFEGSRAQDKITGPDGKPDSFVDDQHTIAELNIHPQSTIKVEKGWEVRSDEAF